MADLGDLGDFFKEGAIVDLDWLDPRAPDSNVMPVLPMQNLDIVPDLESLWRHDDRPPTSYKPLDNLPKTMGDMSQVHGPLRSMPLDIIRTARLALIQSPDLTKWQSVLQSRYDLDSLKFARTALSGVLAERGLLGKFYIQADDFDDCFTGSTKSADFVKKYARSAKYVVAKQNCNGCIHAVRSTVGSKSHCSVFHKELVITLPYSEAMANKVEQEALAKGKAVLASQQDPKERIRSAMLAPDVTEVTQKTSWKPIVPSTQFAGKGGSIESLPELYLVKNQQKTVIAQQLAIGALTLEHAQKAHQAIDHADTVENVHAIIASLQVNNPNHQYTGVGVQPQLATLSPQELQTQLIATSNLLKKKHAAMEAEAARIIAAKKPVEVHPIAETIRKELLRGRYASEIINILKQTHPKEVLAKTQDIWLPELREAGFYGTLYTTQDSFEDCREGSDFLAKHNPGVKAVVAGARCEGCFYNKISRCLLYGKPLAKQASDLVTWENAHTLLHEHKAAGRIPYWRETRQASLGSTPYEAIKNLHQEATPKNTPFVVNTRLDGPAHAFYGSTTTQVTSGLTKRDILKTAAQFLNEGLYGKDLLQALKTRYDSRDILATQQELRTVLAEQGLQGVYYIDPTVYSDYGKGCEEVSRLYRTKNIPYVKLGSKCSTCVSHVQQGRCEKIGKALVIEPPYMDKAAQQRAILASGSSLQVSNESLMSSNNGVTMMMEYDLQQREIDVSIDPVKTASDLEIQFSEHVKTKVP